MKTIEGLLYGLLILIGLAIMPVCITLYNIREIQFKETCIKSGGYMTEIGLRNLVCNKK